MGPFEVIIMMFFVQCKKVRFSIKKSSLGSLVNPFTPEDAVRHAFLYAVHFAPKKAHKGPF